MQPFHADRRPKPHILGIVWLLLCLLVAPWSAQMHAVQHGLPLGVQSGALHSDHDATGLAAKAVSVAATSSNDPWPHQQGTAECRAMDAGLQTGPVVAPSAWLASPLAHPRVLVFMAPPLALGHVAGYQARGPPQS
jgi:hypothetical protein